MELSFNVDGNVKWHSFYDKITWCFLKKLIMELSYDLLCAQKN